MKIRHVLGSFLSLLFLACSSGENVEELNQEALSAELVDTSGNVATLEQAIAGLKGKKTVVKIWAAWCGDCIKSIPDFKKLQEANPEVNYLWLSVDYGDDAWKKRIAKSELQGNHYLVKGLESGSDWKTNAFTKNVNLDWIPRYLVLDEQGKLAKTSKLVKATDPALSAAVQ